MSQSLPVRWENVGADVAPAPTARAEWAMSQRHWARGWRGAVLIFLPLIYVIYVAGGVHDYSHGGNAVAGYGILSAFCLGYVALVCLFRSDRRWLSPWRFWPLYVFLVALFAAEVPFARAPAFVLGLYLVMIGVGGLGARATPIVIGLTMASIVVPAVVPSWHQSLSSAIGNFTPIAIPVAALVTFVVTRGLRSAFELAEARAELARLAAENERNRIARDLHDLLGHSLTTITVKAGLARRLANADSGRAVQEIAEVEALCRQALAEVRAAVSSYRDVTLAGELARGRELLRASGVSAELPTATDMVTVDNQELFGWTVREGLTNVARHAHATRCTVALTASEVEICDDGVGGAAVMASGGNGLAGLRERVAAVGGTLEAGPLSPRGWRLRVSLGPPMATPA